MQLVLNNILTFDVETFSETLRLDDAATAATIDLMVNIPYTKSLTSLATLFKGVTFSSLIIKDGNETGEYADFKLTNVSQFISNNFNEIATSLNFSITYTIE